MSLQVWLPFNGDLKNNGLDYSINFVGSPTYDTGKYGQCRNNGTISGTSSILTSNKGFAFSLWWKISNDDTYSIKIPINTGVKDDAILSFSKMDYSSSATPHYAIKLSATNNEPQMLWVRDKRHTAGTWTLGEWTHFTVNVLNIDEKMTINIYVNGEKKHSYSSTTYNFTLCPGTITLSGSAAMQDFRLYDTPLSLHEIERDYCSLLIHYPLRDPYIENTVNLLENGRFSSFSKLTMNIVSYQKVNGIDTLTTGSDVTTGSIRTTIPLDKLTNNTAYTLTYKWRLVSGSGSFKVGDWCDNQNVIRKKEYFNGNYWENEIYLPARETYTSTYRFIDFNSVGANSVYEIWDVQLEEKDHSTGFVVGERNGAVIYDCSGRGFDSVDRGELVSVADSVRNSNCIYFTSDNAIKIPSPYGATMTALNDFSVAMWVNLTNAQYSYKTIFTTNYGNNASGNSGWISLNTEGKTLWLYHGQQYQGVSSADYPANEWHHIAVTYKNGMAQWYMDGEKMGEPISDTLGYVNAYEYFSLGDAYLGTQWGGAPFEGMISDFRFYGIAIPASAIKDLYKNSATIDHQGNIHAFEFKEM